MDHHPSPRQVLDEASGFSLRRAVERLREGLFDPLAVRLLTVHEEQLRQAAEAGFREVEAGGSPHLAVVGAYGRGKSHSLTYLEAYARKAGFVTSLVNLDPREIPFHRFREVYRALMTELRIPGTGETFRNVWRSWALQQARSLPENGLARLLPPEMPHLFRSVLAAIARPTVSLSDRQRKAKKHARYRPREFPALLNRALLGEAVPVSRLQHALKYRQVAFYREGSLVCRDDEGYLQMVRSLAGLFRQMGYRGWVLLFDEGESIAQVPVSMRRKSYRLLHALVRPAVPAPGLFPVFAFTDDFFQRVAEEDYARTEGEDEASYFEHNYAEAWRDVTRYELEDFSRADWEELSEKLIHLYARAYGWPPPLEQARRALRARLAEHPGLETRYRLKALVDELDLMHQEESL